MKFELSADVGGTFTDLVFADELGTLNFFKASSTHNNIVEGILNGVDIIAASRGSSRREILENCASFACGTTAATNAILEGKVARTALICTEGFRDVLWIREGSKEDSSDIQIDYPEPYIPRALAFTVSERVNAEGGVERELDIDQVNAIADQLAELKIEAVAVSLLWSFVRPEHEIIIGSILARRLPDVAVSLSHVVSPSIREHRRTSATAIDASLKPIVKKRLGFLEGRLREEGLAGELSFIVSSGGRTSASEVLAKPVLLCLSGPSAAPKAAADLTLKDVSDEANVIATDMGGTSFDVSLVVGGHTPMHRDGSIDGHPFGVSSVDVKTIGAGGGSIARVDEGGFIHVGPESAGAYPGPACYGRGGTRATVTDANLVRGLLNPELFAGGQFTLRRDLALEAVKRDVADPLGISVEEAALLVGVTAEQSMVAAIEDITIRKGIDPRTFTLVSGGAAAGLHAAEIGRELGIKTILFPQPAGVLSAYGIATGDAKLTFSRNFFASSADFNYEGVAVVLRQLAEQGTSFLDRMKVVNELRELRFSVQARYAGQVWQLELPLPSETIASSKALSELVEAFHTLHEMVYSVRANSNTVEFIEWEVIAIGRRAQIANMRGPKTRTSAYKPKGTRLCYLDRSGKPSNVAIYDKEQLPEGATISGPALVEDPLFTVLIPDNAIARVTRNVGIVAEWQPVADQARDLPGQDRKSA